MIIEISTLQSCLHGTVFLSVIVSLFFLYMAWYMSLFDFDTLVSIARIILVRNSDTDEIVSLHAYRLWFLACIQTLVPPEAVFLHLAVSLEGGT